MNRADSGNKIMSWSGEMILFLPDFRAVFVVATQGG
jgi:hypothetical protein